MKTNNAGLEIQLAGIQLQLLPDRAIYLEKFKTLLVSDVHLGKSETFQSRGIPIPNQVNQGSLDRLQTLCQTFQPEQLIVLGDLFHSRFALVDELLEHWSEFMQTIHIPVRLVVGNHDRGLISRLEKWAIDCIPEILQQGNLILSHEPAPQDGCLNICGHIHPCVRIKTRLDNLRLPCFYLKQSEEVLILPSFGEFTGGYEMPLNPGIVAYVPVENTVIPFKGTNRK